MENITQKLTNLINSTSLSKWGTADISDIGLPKYNSVISLAQAYSYDIQKYNPHDLNDFLLGVVQNEISSNINVITEFLRFRGIDYYVVPNVQKDPVLSIGEFSDKLAAVRSGIGWIGKNGLLVTEEYGTRVRLSAILVDAKLPVSETKSFKGCGECDICVKMCPAKCLTGAEWKVGMKREDIVDVFKCVQKVKKVKDYMCGFCLLSCPVGRREEHKILIKGDAQNDV